MLFKEGYVVQSKTFSEYRNLGNPYDSIKRLSEWGADEVSFIDIGSRGGNSQHRNDLGRNVIPTYLEVLEKLSETTNMPLSSGGKIKSLNDISSRLSRGADKVVINTASYASLSFLPEAIRNFGSQCITVSMDVKLDGNEYKVYVENGTKVAFQNIDYWLARFNQIEIGELLLNSIDRDGTKIGFDKKLVEYVSKRIEVPLIVCGGAGKWEDFEEVLEMIGVLS